MHASGAASGPPRFALASLRRGRGWSANESTTYPISPGLARRAPASHPPRCGRQTQTPIARRRRRSESSRAARRRTSRNAAAPARGYAGRSTSRRGSPVLELPRARPEPRDPAGPAACPLPTGQGDQLASTLACQVATVLSVGSAASVTLVSRSQPSFSILMCSRAMALALASRSGSA